MRRYPGVGGGRDIVSCRRRSCRRSRRRRHCNHQQPSHNGGALRTRHTPFTRTHTHHPSLAPKHGTGAPAAGGAAADSTAATAADTATSHHCPHTTAARCARATHLSRTRTRTHPHPSRAWKHGTAAPHRRRRRRRLHCHRRRRSRRHSTPPFPRVESVGGTMRGGRRKERAARGGVARAISERAERCKEPKARAVLSRL